MSKAIANKGIPRNKKPLHNYIIIVEIVQPKPGLSIERLNEIAPYKFKELGYLTYKTGLESQYRGNGYIEWHGFISPDKLKEKLGVKQWGKLCQGKREFIIQRRINGKNIPKTISKKSGENIW